MPKFIKDTQHLLSLPFNLNCINYYIALVTFSVAKTKQLHRKSKYLHCGYDRPGIPTSRGLAAANVHLSDSCVC